MRSNRVLAKPHSPTQPFVVPDVPREIYIRIVEHLGRRDVLALCMACKPFERHCSFGLTEWRIEYRVRNVEYGEAGLEKFDRIFNDIVHSDMAPKGVSASLCHLASCISRLQQSQRKGRFEKILALLQNLPSDLRVPVLIALDKQADGLQADQKWAEQQLAQVRQSLTLEDCQRIDFACPGSRIKTQDDGLALLAKLKDKAPSSRARALLDLLLILPGHVWTVKFVSAMLEQVKLLEDAGPGLMAALAQEMRDVLTQSRNILLAENDAAFDLLVDAAQGLPDHQAEEVLRPVVSFAWTKGTVASKLASSLTTACLRSIHKGGPWDQLVRINFHRIVSETPDVVIALIERYTSQMQQANTARSPLAAFKLACRLPEPYLRTGFELLWSGVEKSVESKAEQERSIKNLVMDLLNPNFAMPASALPILAQHVQGYAQAFSLQTMERLASFTIGMSGERRKQALGIVHLIAASGALERNGPIEVEGKTAAKVAEGQAPLASLAIMLCDSSIEAPAGLGTMLGDHLKQRKPILPLQATAALAIEAIRLPCGESRRKALNLLLLLAHGSGCEPDQFLAGTVENLNLTFTEVLELVSDALAEESATGIKNQGWKLALPFLERAAFRLNFAPTVEDRDERFKQLGDIASAAPRELHAAFLVQLALATARPEHSSGLQQVLNLCLALKPGDRMPTLTRIVLGAHTSLDRMYAPGVLEKILQLGKYLEMHRSDMIKAFAQQFHLVPSAEACVGLILGASSEKELLTLIPILFNNISGHQRSEIALRLLERSHNWSRSLRKHVLLGLAKSMANWPSSERDQVQSYLLTRAEVISSAFEAKVERVLGISE